jgi:hypothetical protein
MDTKRCSKCGQELPATREYFVAKSSRPDGLDSWCKVCKYNHAKKKYDENPEHCRAIQRKWRENNVEKARAASQEWRDKYPERQKDSKRRHREKNREEILRKGRERGRKLRENPEFRAKKRESDKKYRDKNIEKDRQRSRDYRKNKPDIVKAGIRKWYAENPERAMLLKHRRFAWKRGLPDTLTIDQWTHALKYWNGCCAYCGDTPEKITLDHYIPLSNPDCPGTIAKNSIPACFSCNSSKNDANAVYWMTWRFSEEHAQIVAASIQSYFDALE